MALAEQNVNGSLTDNAVRHLRQALLTGELIHRSDARAMAEELQAERAEVARLKQLLAEWEQNQLEATSDAFAEGWSAGGRDAVTVHVSSNPGRIEDGVREVERAGAMRNPYASAAELAEVE